MKKRVLFCTLLAILLLPASSRAFNPPQDTAGPLTARVEVPATITDRAAPIEGTVVLENKGQVEIKGSIHLSVIDSWHVDPAEPKPFSVGPAGTLSVDFTAHLGEPTYNALYPVHAFVEFDSADGHQTAHPIAIIETKLPRLPETKADVKWAPRDVPANTAVSLSRTPVFRVMLQELGKDAVTMPVGWQGVDDLTGAHVDRWTSASRPDARSAIGIHPPWRNSPGTLVVEYPLHLPGVTPIRLTSANAMRDTTGTEPASDGVTFRVRILPLDAPDGTLGEVVAEHHVEAKTWQPFDVDLSAYAGRAVRLQLESHPGPRNDTTCDAGFWAEPTLVAGQLPSKGPKKDVTPVSLGTVSNGGRQFNVQIQSGQRGLLDAEISFTNGDSVVSFSGFNIRVKGDSLQDPASNATLKGIDTENIGEVVRVHHRFENEDGTFDLVGELQVENGTALRAAFRLENAPEPKPWNVYYIEDISLGGWNAKASRVYAGIGNVLEEPEAFTLPFDSHQFASSFVGFDFLPGFSLVEAVDVPPGYLQVDPQKRLYTIHAPLAQTVSLIPAPTVWQGAAVWRDLCGLKRAGGVEKLAGRFVFDLWGGAYGASADELAKAFRYGLTDSAVVWHNWQRWGYDYRLPDIYPPNPDLGTLEDMQRLAQVCKQHDVIFAPHDNYIDFYPDAEGFSYEKIAFSSPGSPVRAWLNEGRGAQSFRWRTDALQPFVDRNLKLIKDNVAPTGFFIDVWSSIGPYESWTFDGNFIDRLTTRDTWGQTFAWIRDYLGDNAPQISEGGHDQLIGYLDGAQCNHLRVDDGRKYGWMVWNVRCKDSERIPWLDMAHHDRFALHGAGYSSRYQGGLDASLHGIYSDDYTVTEVLDGHPGMVGEPFNRHVVRKYWLLHDLMRDLALQRIDGVEFAANNIHRTHVTWSGGSQTHVNRGKDDWNVNNHVLPEYGFHAQTAQTEAAVERRDGIIVEWSRTPETVYVNARPVIGEGLAVSATAERVEMAGNQVLDLKLKWMAEKPLDQAYNIFAHFTDEQGKILFQADHTPSLPTNQWDGEIKTEATARIPDEIKPGTTVEIRVGLWKPGSARLTLRGLSDSEQRLRLGHIVFQGDGSKITGLAFAAQEPVEDPLIARQNTSGKTIDFDGIRTNGACRVARNGSGLIVTPLPEGKAFELRLKREQLPFEIPEPKRCDARDESGKVLQKVDLAVDGNEIVLTCDPATFDYSLSAD